jgi:succinate-semialdehyde dehydrogenase/glutarate-semialdehyde dehydrogenase
MQTLTKLEWAVVGRINNGESCVASKRFIAVEAIADEFLEKFKEKMSNLILTR